MATANILSVCNQALLAVGNQSQISSLSEGSPQANACSTLYTPRFEALGRSANWNCLRAQTTLTLLAAAQGTPENPQGTTLPLPPTPWLYEYALPTLCLQMRFIQPFLPAPNAGVPIFSTNTGSPTCIGGQGQIPYVVSTGLDANNNVINVVLTNQSNAIAVYTLNQPNPQLWDSLFEQAMVASLAAWLVPALSLHLPLMQAQIAIAERLIMEARVRDGDEGVTSMDHIPDWIRARQGATGMYWRYGRNGGGCGTWPGMSWPSY